MTPLEPWGRRSAKLGLGLGIVLTWLVGTHPATAQLRCSVDTDCEGELVCMANTCGREGTQPATTQLQCHVDTDCQGDLVCTANRCAPDGAAVAPVPDGAAVVPVPAVGRGRSGQGGACTWQSDCADLLACVGRACVARRVKAPEKPTMLVLGADMRIQRVSFPDLKSATTMWSPGLHFGTELIGFAVRYVSLGGAPGIGMGGVLFRFATGLKLFGGGGWTVALQAPSIEVGAMFVFPPSDDEPVIGFMGNIDPLGLQVSKGNLHVGVRPTIGFGGFGVKRDRFKADDDIRFFFAPGAVTSISLTF